MGRDFYLEVQKGRIPGHSLVHKFGRNDTVGNGWEGVNILSELFSFSTAAATVRIKAGGHANDTTGGVGAQAITVVGISDALVEASESIETAAAAASSATDTKFWRVYRAHITPGRAGTYGAANTTAVVIENGTGGTDLISIAAGEGQTQYGAYTIPSGKTGYFLGTTVTTDGAKPADVRVFTRANMTDFATPFSPKLLKYYWDGILGSFVFAPRSPALVLPALTDIWFEANGGGGGSEVTVDFEILLVDDGSEANF